MDEKNILILDQATKVGSLAEYFNISGFSSRVINVSRQLCSANMDEIMERVRPETEIALVEIFYFLDEPEALKIITEKIEFVFAYTTLETRFISPIAKSTMKKIFYKPMDPKDLIEEIKKIYKGAG